MHDGDTIRIKIEVTLDLRLKQANGGGCYAPEVVGAEKVKGIPSRDHLSSIALNKKVRFFIPTDKAKKLGDLSSLSRELGDAWVIDEPDYSLSELQIMGGFASSTKDGPLGS